MEKERENSMKENENNSERKDKIRKKAKCSQVNEMSKK